MSYLGYPRLNFAGTVQTDVATANNAPQYFDNDLFEPRFQWRMNMPDVNGLWNPRGPGTLRLVDVTVTSVCRPDGTLVTDPRQDPVVGGRLVDDDLRTNAKMVDLDPANQMVPEIYGWRPRLLDKDGRELLRGDFLPSAVEDLWPRADLPSGRPDMSGTYQSVLTGLAWAPRTGSPLLDALRGLTQEDMLSVKLTMDAVEDGVEHWPDTITLGRVTGSLGPYFTGEPKRFLAGRRLRKPAAGGRLNHAPCRVDEKSATVFVDLGNSIRAVGRGGPPEDVGPLRLAVLDADGKAEALAPLRGLDKGFQERGAGIATARLTRTQLDLVSRRRLALVDAAPQPAVLLAENADATWVHADGFVFRLHPEGPAESASTTLYATRYGKPAAGLRLALDAGKAPQPVVFPAEAVTDAAGRARVTFTGKDPGSPREHLDGVTAEISYGPLHRPGDPDGTVSVRVFDVYRAPRRPTWISDVQPLFQTYANLFPVMRDILDLGDYRHVLRHRTYIRRTLLAPVDSPNHMPVTRDLSPGKRDMIVRWLDSSPEPPLLEITTPAGLREILQQAMLVELATVPPYLAALLSIKPGRNAKIASLIRAVVLEEMQHMAQVCNLLNAVGGAPRIGRPGAVPTYPGKLPAAVLPDLEVRLRRLSLEHVRDVFMAIEQPQHPMVDGKPFKGHVISPDSVRVSRSGEVRSVDDAAVATLETWFTKAEYEPQTIAWLYNRIARAIVELDAEGDLFTGDPARQVGWPDAPGTLYKVTDKRSALLAVHQIVEQGEGSPHDLDGNGLGDPGELGHYYMFQEIVEGRQLKRDSSGKWAFDGPAIPFDPDGVYPMVDDPDTYRLPADSLGRRESLRCDTSYTNLLKGLDRVFNGHPEEMDNTVGLMFQVQVEARKLLAVPSSPGAKTVLGPAFQSPGVDLGQ
ncbi:ferritin-like domain-containing protein [Streptomyces sp. NPDC059788]|uniref:ferritin-like domain-containing protein n=1 Tax=Streptomyces sp. NPDC059788 TaxID=3346948 RepID=UPI00365F4B7F